MTPATFAEQIFDALQEFDRTITPFGLYSVRDVPLQADPQKIMSRFKTQIDSRRDLSPVREFCDDLMGVGRWGTGDSTHFYLTVPEFGSVALKMVRTSKIKVRQYGDSYHLDKNLNYENRWEKLELDQEIPKLRHQGSGWHMLLFLGFDKAQQPFERELSTLKPHQTRESHGIEFFERSGDDSIGRGFKIKAALWMH